MDEIIINNEPNNWLQSMENCSVGQNTSNYFFHVGGEWGTWGNENDHHLNNFALFSA